MAIMMDTHFVTILAQQTHLITVDGMFHYVHPAFKGGLHQTYEDYTKVMQM